MQQCAKEREIGRERGYNRWITTKTKSRYVARTVLGPPPSCLCPVRTSYHGWLPAKYASTDVTPASVAGTTRRPEPTMNLKMRSRGRYIKMLEMRGKGTG